MATSLTSSTPKRTVSARGASARAARDARFQDIAGLRAKLPRYWWNEVSRVRALIERDVETGGLAAEHLSYVAEALAGQGDPLAGQGDAELTREHAMALWAASRQLSGIARGHSSAAA